METPPVRFCDRENAYRFNGAGETLGITHIPGAQEVMICTD